MDRSPGISISRPLRRGSYARSINRRASKLISSCTAYARAFRGSPFFCSVRHRLCRLSRLDKGMPLLLSPSKVEVFQGSKFGNGIFVYVFLARRVVQRVTDFLSRDEGRGPRFSRDFTFLAGGGCCCCCCCALARPAERMHGSHGTARTWLRNFLEKLLANESRRTSA